MCNSYVSFLFCVKGFVFFIKYLVNGIYLTAVTADKKLPIICPLVYKFTLLDKGFTSCATTRILCFAVWTYKSSFHFSLVLNPLISLSSHPIYDSKHFTIYLNVDGSIRYLYLYASVNPTIHASNSIWNLSNSV